MLFLFCFSYFVLGSVGNVYTVKIGSMPSCDCPDHMRGNLCKHILFIYLKVLRVSNHRLLYQTSLLESELKRIFQDFDKAEKGRNRLPMANSAVRENYEKLINENENIKIENENENIKKEREIFEQKPVSSDTQCPVCCEEFIISNEEITYCRYGCGNNVHVTCLKQWSSVSSKSITTCVVCRSPWSSRDFEALESEQNNDRFHYINLAHLQTDS